jgi:hypothetical protein
LAPGSSQTARPSVWNVGSEIQTQAMLAGRKQSLAGLYFYVVVKLYGTCEIDNRDREQVYEYMESCIEALKQCIHELEAQKESLQAKHGRRQIALKDSVKEKNPC